MQTQMKLVLTGLKKLEWATASPQSPPPGFRQLRVEYCAICRTDAKMWREGHRDLVFPRVPGHEFVGRDQTGSRYTVWPGSDCGRCRYCLSGRENLCEDMKITGFHHDGGFAQSVLVPGKSLIPVPDSMPAHIACFTEPTGCVFNALNKLNLQPGERLIIYGGGTVGLIAALVAQQAGAKVLVIEKNEQKIDRIGAFLQLTGIPCAKDSTDSEFDAALNACPDPIAFSLSTVKLGKGGRLSFFSGLKKNETLETNLVNLMHYKEVALHGAYGLKRCDMVTALSFMADQIRAYETLIEKVVAPATAPNLMSEILDGHSLKYIIDFKMDTPLQGDGGLSEAFPNGGSRSTQPAVPDPQDENTIDPLAAFCARVEPVGDRLRPAAQYKIDNKTKPLGALGTLEALALQMSLIQNRLDPQIDGKALIVFAADHGIAEEGVSAYPTEVTGQMVKNFLKGGAAINALCRHHEIDMCIVDMGVKIDFERHPLLESKKVRRATRNFAVQPAMTRKEALQAVNNGMDVLQSRYGGGAWDIVGMGEMGIGNTTSASAIISLATGITPAAATGRGTGVDNKGLEHKAETIQKALDFHKPNPRDGFEILQTIGGFEIAGIVGAVLAAAGQKKAVVLDGLISTAAGLLAYLICPAIKGYLISGHKSVEVAQKAALDHIGLKPVIDFDMRLGEGTGAAMAIDAVAAACRIMRDMASFDEAGVSKQK